MSQFFVTGTDTEVGKTFISSAIMAIANAKQISCVGYKPISAGCEMTPEGLRNEDALCLLESSTVEVSYDEVNPFAYVDAVAPHLAAAKTKQPICLDSVLDGLQNLRRKKAELTLVEGAGGWRLPVGEGRFLSEFVVAAQLPVVLVVGMRLGCLNHAILTYESVLSSGLQVAGWVANHREMEMPYLRENIDSLKEMLDAPFLGEVPLVKSAREAAQYLDITPLLHLD